MTLTDQSPATSQVWWQSRTVWCAVVPLIVSLSHLAGITLPSDVQASLPDILASTAGSIGSIGAIIYRIKAEKPIAPKGQ